MRSRHELAFLLCVVTLELLPVLVFSRSPVIAAAMATLAFATALLALSATAAGLAPLRPSTFERVLAPVRPRTARPPDLERLERDVALGASSARVYHERVRPLVRAAAARRLSERRGLDLDGQPEAAREALGDDVWDAITAPDPRALLDGRPGRPVAPVLDAIEAL